MSNEPTFANSLDRHIFTYIEAITDHLPDGPEPDVFKKVLDFGGDTLTVCMNLQKESIFYVSQESKDGKTGQLVYQRIEGRTRTCRAGDWMRRVLDEGLEVLAHEARQMLSDEVEKANERAVAFAPL